MEARGDVGRCAGLWMGGVEMNTSYNCPPPCKHCRRIFGHSSGCAMSTGRNQPRPIREASLLCHRPKASRPAYAGLATTLAAVAYFAQSAFREIAAFTILLCSLAMNGCTVAHVSDGRASYWRCSLGGDYFQRGIHVQTDTNGIARFDCDGFDDKRAKSFDAAAKTLEEIAAALGKGLVKP